MRGREEAIRELVGKGIEKIEKELIVGRSSIEKISFYPTETLKLLKDILERVLDQKSIGIAESLIISLIAILTTRPERAIIIGSLLEQVALAEENQNLRHKETLH